MADGFGNGHWWDALMTTALGVLAWVLKRNETRFDGLKDDMSVLESKMAREETDGDWQREAIGELKQEFRAAMTEVRESLQRMEMKLGKRGGKPAQIVRARRRPR